MKKKEELDIVLSDQVKQKMSDNPELAESMRDMFACMRQAQEGVVSGKYASFDDAMEAITGNRPEAVDLDD